MNEQYDEYNEVIKQLEAKCAELKSDFAVWRDYAGKQNDKTIEQEKTIAALQQQIKVYREALEIKCLYFGQTEKDREALAQPIDCLTHGESEQLKLLKQENQILIEELKEARAESGRFGVGA